LLTTLAERQLQLGQSVILDSVASTLSIRATWRALAAAYRAEWRVIECICSDEAAQRDRMNVRQRNIPDWHELDWSEVERVKAYYAPWNEERLILDAVNSLAENIAAALRYLRR
jgi:predicted kinase